MAPRVTKAATGTRRSTRTKHAPELFAESSLSVTNVVSAGKRKAAEDSTVPAAKRTAKSKHSSAAPAPQKRGVGRPKKANNGNTDQANTSKPRPVGRPKKTPVSQKTKAAASSKQSSKPSTSKAGASTSTGRKAPASRKPPAARNPTSKRKADEEGETPEPKSKKVKTEKSTKASAPKVVTAPKGPPAPSAATTSSVLTQLNNAPPTDKLVVFLAGVGENGELGMGSGKAGMNAKRPRLNPNLASDTVGVVQIATGAMHCAALTYDNKILTWGVNDQGALGRSTEWDGGLKDMDTGDSSDSDSDSDDTGLNPRESTPAAVSPEHFPEGTRFASLATADNATFALTTGGHVYGWGTFRDNQGVLGFTKDGDVQRTPIRIEGLERITSVACGNNHVLALDADGIVFSFGAGQQHQLGREVTDDERFNALKPAKFGLANIKSIHCGTEHSFAIAKDDRVYSWGLNNFGQCGIVTNAGEGEAAVKEPSLVTQLLDEELVMLKGGNHHSLAVNKDGQCLIWGRADGGQVGVDLSSVAETDVARSESSGRIAMLKRPTLVSGLPQGNISYATTATDHSIAITTDGKAYSWGFSILYQTGLGTDEDVKIGTLVENTAVKNKKLNWAGCGSQYSVFTCVAEPETMTNGTSAAGAVPNGVALQGTAAAVNGDAPSAGAGSVNGAATMPKASNGTPSSMGANVGKPRKAGGGGIGALLGSVDGLMEQYANEGRE